MDVNIWYQLDWENLRYNGRDFLSVGRPRRCLSGVTRAPPSRCNARGSRQESGALLQASPGNKYFCLEILKPGQCKQCSPEI